jgi:hypothetical protein
VSNELTFYMCVSSLSFDTQTFGSHRMNGSDLTQCHVLPCVDSGWFDLSSTLYRELRKAFGKYSYGRGLHT